MSDSICGLRKGGDSPRNRPDFSCISRISWLIIKVGTVPTVLTLSTNVDKNRTSSAKRGWRRRLGPHERSLLDSVRDSRVTFVTWSFGVLEIWSDFRFRPRLQNSRTPRSEINTSFLFSVPCYLKTND